MERFSHISNARILDVETETVSAGQSIVLRAGRIEDPRGVRLELADEFIDADGAYVCPGLIDCHVHLFLDASPDPLSAFLKSDDTAKLRIAARNARLAIEAGITTVRDCGGPADLVFRFRQMIETGEMSGPAVIACGAPLTRVGGHCHFFGGEVSSPREVRSTIARQSRMGAGLVKLIASGGGLTPGTRAHEADLTPEIMREAVGVAHACGIHVAAHCHATDSILRALDAGVDFIEHASFATAGGPPQFDPEIAARMRDQGVIVSPTVISGIRIARELRNSAGVDGPDHATIQRLESRPRHAGMFYETGVKIIAGSDCGVAGTPFDSLADELIGYSDIGIPCALALRSATCDSARYLGQPLLGQVKSGFAADLLLLHDNPLHDLAALKNPLLVIKKGVIVCDRRNVTANVS